MNEMRRLMRAKRWAQNPPSAKRVKLVLWLIAGCLAIAGVEHFIGWPDWMTLDPAHRNRLLR